MVKDLYHIKGALCRVSFTLKFCMHVFDEQNIEYRPGVQVSSQEYFLSQEREESKDRYIRIEKKLAHQDLQERWQDRCENGGHARWTYHLIPDIKV